MNRGLSQVRDNRPPEDGEGEEPYDATLPRNWPVLRNRHR
jgi:hypothetical protein